MPDVRELLHDAAATPTASPDIDALWQRGRIRRAVAWTGSTTLAVALIAVVGTLLIPNAAPPSPIIGEAPDGVVAAPRTTPLLDGWQEIRVGNASFGVPGNWASIDVGGQPDVDCTIANRVYLVGAGARLACDEGSIFEYVDQPEPGVIVLAGDAQRFDPLDPGLAVLPIAIEGLSAVGTERTSGANRDCPGQPNCSTFERTTTSVVVAELDLALELSHVASGTVVEQIIATIERVGPASEVQDTDTTPKGWQTLQQGTIAFDVPASLTVASVSGSRCWQRVADVQLDLDQLPEAECRGGLEGGGTVMVDAGLPAAFAPTEGAMWDGTPEEQVVGGMRALVSSSELRPSCPPPGEDAGDDYCPPLLRRLIVFPDRDVALRISSGSGDAALIEQVIGTIRPG